MPHIGERGQVCGPLPKKGPFQKEQLYVHTPFTTWGVKQGSAQILLESFPPEGFKRLVSGTWAQGAHSPLPLEGFFGTLLEDEGGPDPGISNRGANPESIFYSQGGETTALLGDILTV